MDDLKGAWASMRGSSPHPGEEDLLLYLQKGPDPALEAHLARCGPCLDALLELRALAWAPSSAPAWRRTAAAAACLLVAGGACLWRWGLRPSLAPDRPPVQAAIPSRAGSERPDAAGLWIAGGADAEMPVGASGVAVLWRGSRARLDHAAITLDDGALQVESEGDPVLIRAGGLEVELVTGLAVVEVSRLPVTMSWLLLFQREVLASPGAEIKVSVLRGSVRLAWDGRYETLACGRSVRLGGGGLEACEGPSWKGTGWAAIPAPAFLRDAEAILLPDPPSGYVFEVLVRKCQEEAEVGLLFEAGGVSWSAPVGANLLKVSDSWTRLRIEVAVGECRAAVGGCLVVSRPLGDLERDASPRSGGGVGLRAWRGAVELREARWRALP